MRVGMGFGIFAAIRCNKGAVEMEMDTVNLYRPVGTAELKLIEDSGFREFPPRLPDQPIFYPVTNHPYATQIARDWNVKASGSGFVTRFAVKAEYLSKFQVQTVGGAMHTEYWIPAEELPEFNANIVGKIEVVAEFGIPKDGILTSKERESGQDS